MPVIRIIAAILTILFLLVALSLAAMGVYIHQVMVVVTGVVLATILMVVAFNDYQFFFGKKNNTK